MIYEIHIYSNQWNWIKKIVPDEILSMIIDDLTEKDDVERLYTILNNMEKLPKDQIDKISRYFKSAILDISNDLSTEMWITLLIFVKTHLDFEIIVESIKDELWEYYWNNGDEVDRRSLKSILYHFNFSMLKLLKEE